MSFQTFKNKPISSKVVLLEFASSSGQSFFLNEEPGIWQYKWRVEADTTYNYENGAFCYGCYEQECSGHKTNGNPRVNFISVKVDGENYNKVTNLSNLRTTNKSFWWDRETIHIHFDSFDPPWVFQTIILGAAVTLANKAGIYDEFYYDGRLKSLSPLEAKVDPLFYGLIGYSGTIAALNNEDGEFNHITVFDLYGQTVNILFGEGGAPYSDFELMFSGFIQDFSISESELRLNIKDKRKKFKLSVPPGFFDSTTYPYITEKNENKPIPLLYGECDDIPVICTNEDEATPSTYNFKICDTTYHSIKAISEVRVNGVAKTPTASSLTYATFSLSTSDYSPGDDVTADIQGYTKVGLNILYNSSCEKNVLVHIKGNSGSEINAYNEQVSALKSNGVYSFKMTKTIAAGNGCHTMIVSNQSWSEMHGLTAGKTYRFKAKVYVPSSGGPAVSEVRVRIGEYYSGSWHWYSDAATLQDQWEELDTGAITLNATTTGFIAVVWIMATAEQNEFIYYDELEFYAVDDPWLIENALDVIEDLLANHISLPYTSDNYDQAGWAAAKILAPDIQYFTEKSAKIESIIEGICKSLNGVMFAKSNGKFTFRYLHTPKSIVETIKKTEFFEEIEADYPSENYLSTVALEYDKDYGENELLTYIDDSLEQELLDTYDVSYRYEAETLLRIPEDVQALATNLLNTYAKIAQWVTLSTNISHVQLELVDDMTVELDRINKTWFGDTDMRVYGIRKDVMAGKVELTLRAIG